MKIYQVAKPEVDELASGTGEHANLMIEEHGRGVFLYKAQGDDAVQLDTHAGMRVPLHTTALGKAILAHSPSETVDAIVERHGLQQVTDQTITTREALMRRGQSSAPCPSRGPRAGCSGRRTPTNSPAWCCGQRTSSRSTSHTPEGCGYLLTMLRL
jgi:hypothetical protein